jgi:hypothetical protein
MTSVLNVDTIAAKDGTSPVALTKQYAIKIWINFNGTSTIAIRDSFNVSGIVDEGTGDYTTTFTNSMSSGDYCETDGSLEISTSRSTSVQGDTHSQLSGSLRIKYAVSDDAADGTQASDITFVQQMFVGDLA